MKKKLKRKRKFDEGSNMEAKTKNISITTDFQLV
jgi:hypothetical protein